MSNVHFSFEATGFRDSDETLELNINQIHGYELAAWLHRELQALGLNVTEVGDEDFGWFFHVIHEGHSYFCTTSVAVDDAQADEGHVTVSMDRSLMDRVLGRNKLQTNDPVASAIASILRRSDSVSELEQSAG